MVRLPVPAKAQLSFAAETRPCPSRHVLSRLISRKVARSILFSLTFSNLQLQWCCEVVV